MSDTVKMTVYLTRPLHGQLAERAGKENRSLNGQIIQFIQEGLTRGQQVNAEAVATALRAAGADDAMVGRVLAALRA